MMALWMLWATLVTGVLGLAAVPGERVLRVRARPGRFAWAGAMGGSFLLFAGSLLRPAGATAGAHGVGGTLGVVPVDLLAQLRVVAGSSPGALERADPWLVGAWCLASLAISGVLAVGYLRLHRRASRWPRARLGAGEVLISEDFGPALLGVRFPRVVFPRWAFELGAERLAMAWTHEDEHRAARDGWLLLTGVALVALVPWNLALWWQLRRLRVSTEVDCDARVLRRGVSRSAYGSLLVDVGSRASGLSFPVAALSRSPSLLERRLTMIVKGVRRGNSWTTAGALVAAVLLVGLACEAPAPTGVVREDGAAMAGALSKGAEDGQVMMKGVVLIRPGTALPDSLHPLVLVDNWVTDLSRTDLDPKTIERIDILKGPQAVERYGARGANGVIRITTKKGADDGGK